jgi:hypothetical protein
MNMAILTKRARAEEKKENKRKFMEHKDQQQERSQRQRSFGHPVSRFQAPMQYRTQSQATGSQGLSYGPPWAHYLDGYQDRLLGGPLGLPDLRYTAPEGVEHKDCRGEVLG